MNLVTIIIPVYNVEHYLQMCVDSVLQQSYKNLEIILVDDGSPDQCPTLCDQYASQDERVKVIHKSNGGLSSARNVALDIATGKYVMFVDGDDYIHPDTIRDSINIAEKEDADIVQFEISRKELNTTPHDIHYSTYDNRTIFLNRGQRIMLCAKLYRRNLWEEIRMPYGMVNEDDATTWKLYYKSRKIVSIYYPYYHYTHNPNGITAHQKKVMSLDIISHYKERIQFFESVNDKELADYSRWCFCLPIAISLFMDRVKTTDRKIFRNYFKENLPAVLKCKYVPKYYRIALWLFSLTLPK